MFISHRLQAWFCANTMAHLGQKASRDVSDLIVTNFDRNGVPPPPPPPREQLSACSTVNCCPQIQWEGRCDGRQPYRKQRASRKAPLWRANLCSAIGRVESQLEAPFSADTVIALFKLLGRLSTEWLYSIFPSSFRKH